MPEPMQTAEEWMEKHISTGGPRPELLLSLRDVHARERSVRLDERRKALVEAAKAAAGNDEAYERHKRCTDIGCIDKHQSGDSPANVRHRCVRRILSKLDAEVNGGS